MPTYTCPTCSKVFKQKGHFDSHKSRKRPCKPDAAIEALVERKVQEVIARLQPSNPAPPPPIQPIITPIFVKPFLKWVGGKTQILETVLQQFPRQITNYHEPFVGGGSVVLGLLSCVQSGQIKLSGTIRVSDINPNLIALYKNVQTNPDQLIQSVQTHVQTFTNIKESNGNRTPKTMEEATTSKESYYYWIRTMFNQLTIETRKTVQASALFLFLNKTCFRGVYREGPRGFNVPYGNYANPTILEEEHIRQVSQIIQPVIFEAQSYTQSLLAVQAGDFVYLDPPYAPESNKSFVSYTASGFTLDDHAQLFKLCTTLHQKCAFFVMSNADVKLVKDAFPEPTYHTKTIVCRRAIHSKRPETTTNEVLITNHPITQPTI